MKLIFCVIGFIAFTLFSCKKDETVSDLYSATITFIEPANGESLTSGDELHMEIDFQSEGTIPYLDVLAVNETTGDTIYYSGQLHVAADGYYPFHEHVDVIVPVLSNCRVTASTWENDPSIKISKEVLVTVNP